MINAANEDVAKKEQAIVKLKTEYEKQANELSSGQHKAQAQSPVAEVLNTTIAEVPKTAQAVVSDIGMQPTRIAA